MKATNTTNPLFGVLLPLALYIFLRLYPALDPVIEIPVEHFYIVSATSIIAILVGIAVGIAGSRQRNLQVAYVALAFISLATLFSVHGLATPGMLMDFTPLVGIAAQLSVLTMAFWLWLSSLPSSNRISNWLSKYLNLLLILWTLMLLVFAVLALENHHIVDPIPIDENPLQWIVAAATVLLTFVAGYRFWRSYRYSKFPFQLSLTYAAGWLAVSQIILSTSQVYKLSWWIYHLLLFFVVFVPILGLLAQYSRGDSLGKSMRGLFSLDPFERLEAGISPSIRALIAATEARDPYTAGHSERVALGSLKLASALGFSPEDLRVLAQAGLVHDIGKLQVPDKILNKATQLSEKERKIIQDHTMNGYSLCANLGFMKPELEIVRSHHERLDGTGYPDGLRNQEIPALAKIVSIVDVFDALTTERSYRPAWSQAKALDYLLENKQKQFDPNYVDTWVDIAKRDSLGK
jgi:putative nucleotidyltransferase with HDIG domain